MSVYNQTSIILKVKKCNSPFIGLSSRFSFEFNLEKVFHFVLDVYKLGSCRNMCFLGRCIEKLAFVFNVKILLIVVRMTSLCHTVVKC